MPPTAPETQQLPPDPPPLPSQRKEWQFRLRAMMLGMSGFAIFFGVVSIIPTAFTQIALGAFWLVASGWLITGIAFAKNDFRAFCIGATVVATSMWTGLGGRFAQGIQSILRGIPIDWITTGHTGTNNIETWLIHFALAATAVANGWLCIRARRYFERHGGD